ncbi:hypothetical protein AFE02nite_22420 [Actinotalea fermentans]|uniref:Uncharacterized protein n=2 Tax=Actinotalea fermentans TaxID=43671 RepID=A0A511YZ84_9CELL|nr:hypothetical protein AFE02nite_22420 [Actinotalea fermentans]
MNAGLGALAQQRRNREAAVQAGNTNALLGLLLEAQEETNRLLLYIADLEHRRELRELAAGEGQPR